MKFFRCRKCLYTNTKPDIYFSDDGVCSACLAYDARQRIDWRSRELDFLELVNLNKGRTHDVLIACSGGKDSTAQIVKCLEKGIRPLAVTASTDHLSSLGRKNLENISRLCDHVEVTPDKKTRNRIAKFALEEIGDISWCEHHLIWSVPAREAINREIPLVLYGECPQNEYGAGPEGSEKETELSQEWVHEFGGLLGLRLSDLSEILDIDPKQLDIYRRPSTNVRCLFMGAYFPWDGFENAQIAKANGFSTYRFPYAERDGMANCVEGTPCDYENLDNHQTGIHDHLRWLKFGYGRSCDILSNWIRRGRISRDEAIPIALRRDGKWPTTYLSMPLADILAPLGLNTGDYADICKRFTNKPVVEWASQPESFRSCSGPTEDASKVNSFIRGAASAA
jgi:N-acetyl sugar amidotransferase